VFNTNAGEIRGDLMAWDFEPVSFLMKDYEMNASSRVANPWIMMITAVMALVLAAVLFLKRKRPSAGTSTISAPADR
jgi:hypothetical protein